MLTMVKRCLQRTKFLQAKLINEVGLRKSSTPKITFIPPVCNGAEKMEYEALVAGRTDVFDDIRYPPEDDNLGTVKNPIIVQSRSHEKYIGCNCLDDGFNWVNIHRDHPKKCDGCGRTYLLVDGPDYPKLFRENIEEEYKQFPKEYIDSISHH